MKKIINLIKKVFKKPLKYWREILIIILIIWVWNIDSKLSNVSRKAYTAERTAEWAEERAVMNEELIEKIMR